MINRTLLLAASRLSPRMFAYHLKRAARNRLCAKFPDQYSSYIDKAAGSVPPLTCDNLSAVDLAKDVAKFYTHEYRESFKDVAKGKITLFQETVDFGAVEMIDWHHCNKRENDFQLWRQKLGHMGFVCPMLSEGNEEDFEAIFVMLSKFREKAKFSNPECFSSYWFPYSVSHRILAILSGYIIADSNNKLPPSLKNRIAEFLRWNTGFILRNIEHELKNNHVERNLAAICFYFDCVQNVPKKLKSRIDKEVFEYVSECTLEDGMNIERSVMYQGLSAMALNIFSSTRFLSQPTRDLARDRYQRALRSWAVMSHPDGQISLFNDSWFGEVPEVSHISVEPKLNDIEVLPNAGYARLQKGDYFLIFDAAAIGPAWNAAHGHADFLSVEVDIEGIRFIVDPGTFQYSTGPRRQKERSAQNHNGPCWADVNPVEYYGCFKVGRLAEAAISSTSETKKSIHVKGSLQVREGEARRAITVSDKCIKFLDTWSSHSNIPQVRLLIQGEWNLAETSKTRARFKHGNKTVSITVHSGEISNTKVSSWACRYLESRTATEVLLIPQFLGHSEAQLKWTVEKES